MTCEHRDCSETATVQTRFGSGYWRHGRVKHRQTFVRYCDGHFQVVNRCFTLCDVAQLAKKLTRSIPVDRVQRDFEIVVALSEGVSVGDVARRYGLTQARISQIRKTLVVG